MYFILSTGRAGSKTIANALDRRPDTVCLHHPQPELAAEATAFFCGDYPREKIESVLRATRNPRVGGKIYGEVNLQHTLLFPILRDLFPDAQFVWLIRDGRDTVASMYYRGWYDEVYPWQSVAWRKARLHGDRTGDFSPEEWRRLDRFERCCWVWRKYNLLIASQLASLDPALWTKIRLDRLGSAMPRLLEFLGLSRDGKVRIARLNLALQPVSYWPQWTPRQRSAFEQMCGAEMDRWFPEWRSPAGVWRMLAAEPVKRQGRVARAVKGGRALAERVRRRIRRVPLLARIARRLPSWA